jgi:hypothetical protein
LSTPAPCLCKSTTGCGLKHSDSCCAGLICANFHWFTQCIEDYDLPSYGKCVTTDSYGCYLNEKRAVGGYETGIGCCNPDAVCTTSNVEGHICRLPCEL